MGGKIGGKAVKTLKNVCKMRGVRYPVPQLFDVFETSALFGKVMFRAENSRFSALFHFLPIRTLLVISEPYCRELCREIRFSEFFPALI